MAHPIEDYALIGNCETAALVARDGSIDWLCWPRFDSGACFAALLGTPEHGRWQIAPANSAATITRRYRDDTLVLDTEFSTDSGAVTLVDFMPLRDGEQPSQVVRLVVGRSGQVAMSCELVLRFGYGSAIPWVTRLDDGAMRAISGPDMTVLRTPVHLRGDNFKSVARFVVSEGETVPFVLSYGRSYCDSPPGPSNPIAALKDTERFWRDWAAGCREAGKWSDAVRRSLITLKALTYRPTGGIVAAPTTSLPEQLGGARNWDYRYCWLRDATFTLLSLMNSGHYQSAREWREWLIRAVAGSPQQLQIMYGIEGERLFAEVELPWLPGYQGAKPVRIGNAASGQLQLDIYGELMDALYQGHRGGLGQLTASFDLQRAALGHLGEIWREPDDGIWEVRGGRQHFTYSKVMAWVAFDRAVKLAEEFSFEGPVDQWRATRQEIHDDICRNAFNERIGAFTQYYGAATLDASVLLMPLVGFLPASDPRVQGTIAAIERGLMVEGLVMRYDTRSGKDGLAPGEGAFLACSFWYVDNLVLQGRLAEAEQMFEKLCGLRNDVGLLSEEYDPHAKRLVGNFPQAFSHIGMVRSAHNLMLAENALTQRAGNQTGPAAVAPADSTLSSENRKAAQPSKRRNWSDAPNQGDAAFTIYRDEFRSVLGADFRCPALIETNAHEGPVYVASEHALYFTTVPEPGPKNIAIKRIQLSGKEFPFKAQALDTVRFPSNMANGMTLDRDGRLVICEQGTREAPARISRMDLRTGSVETVVDRWRGLRFNSPNDVVVKGDRTIWFTDPNYGEIQGFKDVPEVGAFVYRHDPATGETAVVADSFNKPNGLAFSPDESVLYITDTGANQAPGNYFVNLPHHIRAFDVHGGRHLRNDRVFAVVSPGAPDGIKIDVQGRVYTSSATGVQVFTPDGDLLGEIKAPSVANFTFGGPDNDVLFILGDTQIWQAKLDIAGMRTC